MMAGTVSRAMAVTILKAWYQSLKGIGGGC